MAFSTSPPRNLLSPHGWRQLASDAHFAQFFDNDATLVETVAEHLGAGLLGGARVLVVARGDHLESIEITLRDWGLQIDQAREWGHYRALDAAQTLACFMRDGQPDPVLFRRTIEPLLPSNGQGRTVAFGEMVGLLWREGHHGAAIALEAQWNELLQRHHVSLLCGYAAADMHGMPDGAALHQICAHHHAVIAPSLWPQD